APLRNRRPTRFRKGGDECFLYLRLFHEFCEPKRGLEPRDPWAAAVELSLGGVGVRALSPADELLYLCLNGARTSPWPNVVWIADAMTVFDAAGPEIDWERLVLQATQLRATLRLRDALLFIREELDARVPDDVLRDLD